MPLTQRLLLTAGFALARPVVASPAADREAADAAPIPEKFATLPLGAVQPRGWLRQQLEANLAGFTGHLDELVPDLIRQDEIYGRDRLTPAVRHKELGAQGVPETDRAQFLWWNSETQSNWWDGLVRTAVLLDEPAALRRTRAQVDALLATQDPDGYLGIYAPALRYRFHDENGELWAKATCCRYLLGWYEHTRDEKVRQAVVRAVDNLMAHYPAGASHPFRSDRPATSGLTHGLMITDILESLYRLTGDRRYADYLLFCYRDFSVQPLAEDAQLAKLLDPAAALRGHGAHTYEHLRAVAAAYQVSGDPQLRAGLEAFLHKIDRCTTVTGGPVGDEFINGGGADSTGRGYEYCSLQELGHSYESLLVKTGRREFGDLVERLFFNAAQGARHPQGRGVAYLKSDNSYAMTGPLNADPATPEQTRYKYSPTHRDAAVCCVPNAGRIGPYYIQHMWLAEGDALVAALLGPCAVQAQVRGRTVRITEETDYPRGATLRFTIEGAEAGLVLKVRRPVWAKRLVASRPYVEQEGFLRFDIPAGPGPQVLTVDLDPTVETCRVAGGETAFCYGPLVLSHALAAEETVAKIYPVGDFADLTYTPRAKATYQAPASPALRPVDGAPWCVDAELNNAATGRKEWVRIEPMGGTLLRQVTFPPASSAAH